MQGSLTLIIGPMFSGKTTELIRHLSNVSEVGCKALYINHTLDTRANLCSTHNPQMSTAAKFKMVKVTNLSEVNVLEDDYQTIGVDEAHFFNDLITIVNWVDKYHKQVIVAGLDGDYNRKLFGHIAEFIPHCDTITKLTANCVICAKSSIIKKALFSHRYTTENNLNNTVSNDRSAQIEIGAHDKYASLCRSCYISMSKP